MAAERANFPVTMMAGLLGVSRSGFYGWLSRRPGPDPWAATRAEAERVWAGSRGRFGARKVHAVMQAGPFAGTTLYRVRRCMRELGIRGVAPNQRKRTTIPDELLPLI